MTSGHFKPLFNMIFNVFTLVLKIEMGSIPLSFYRLFSVKAKLDETWYCSSTYIENTYLHTFESGIHSYTYIP